MDDKPKGFGYVEFGTLDGLKKALTLTDSQFMGRPIRISVAEPRKYHNHSQRASARLTSYPAKDRGETRDFSDWSRKGPLPDLPSQGRQMSRGFSQRGNFDNASDAGSERGGKKSGYFQDDGKVRDLGNWERRGPLSPVPGSGPPVRDGGRLRDGASRDGGQSPGWGEAREGSSRPARRDGPERPQVERVPTAAEQDNQWRARMRPDPSPAATPDVSTPSSPQPQAAKERPKLNLAKRTVSTVDQEATTPSGDAKASPFGAARPIDTSAREKEVAEKRELALRQKKEADDKAREEKAAKDAAAKTRSTSTQEEKITSPITENGARRPSRQQNGSKNNVKENGETPTQKEKPSFSILRRDAEGGDEEEHDVPDASANGTIVADKETKPQEVIREVPADGAATASTPDGTAENMTADGWSTVAGKQKNNRRGGARALAS